MPGPEDECEIPHAVEVNEKVVRAIKTPYYFHKKRKDELIPQALFPRAGSSDVSVTRQLMGDDYCADMSRKTVKPINSSDYCGMLVMGVESVRTSGSEVYDFRQDFCGHAHLTHGIEMPPKGETMDPKISEELKERCKKIIEAAAYHRDAYEAGPGWTGSPL